MQTFLVILIIAAAILYVAWRYRPSKLKSGGGCDSCPGCSANAGKGKEFTTTLDNYEPGSTCCGTEDEPCDCVSSDRKQ